MSRCGTICRAWRQPVRPHPSAAEFRRGLHAGLARPRAKPVKEARFVRHSWTYQYSNSNFRLIGRAFGIAVA